MEPHQWQVIHFADIGMSEEFVKVMTDVLPLVDAGTIYEPERKEVNEAINSILIDGLMPAFSELRQIREMQGKAVPVINRMQPYEDIARKLWNSYSKFTPHAARLMGFKIGFLFDNDKEFKKGCEEFRKQNPKLQAGFEEFFQQTRDNWQDELASFRNKWLEHPVGDRKKYHKFYALDYAEGLFDAVWRTIVDILVVLLQLRMHDGWTIVRQHPDDPGPKWVNTFRFENPKFTNL